MSTFQAVICGSDISAYALARELNEAYGIKPILVSRFTPPVVRDSHIVSLHYAADTQEGAGLSAALLSLGRTLKAEDPDRDLLLLANSDRLITDLAEHLDQLSEFYTVPIPSLETIRLVSDKQSFSRLATACGMSTPHSIVADFSNLPPFQDTTEAANSAAGLPLDLSTSINKLPPFDELTFPLIAKPAKSSEYEHLMFEGFQKVYLLTSRDEVSALWKQLAQAGFRGTFLLQDLVTGDDTTMFSVTAYVDSRGTVSLLSSAQVLLEEHSPMTLGVPCAMITTAYPELFEQVRRFFDGLDYHGFANFDVKRDSQTGRFFFLEVNPRIGRNNFYVRGAGLNPMEYLVSDVIKGKPLAPAVAEREVLYTIIPKHLLLRYISEPALRQRVKRLYREHKVVNPTLNRHDRSLRRQVYQYLAMFNQYRKFRAYYPKVTATGF